MTLIFLPSRSPELNPVESVWQYLRQNWLANRVFDTYDAIIDAVCRAWNNLIDRPETTMSIGKARLGPHWSRVTAVGISQSFFYESGGYCHRLLSRIGLHEVGKEMG